MYISTDTKEDIITIAGNRPLLLNDPDAVWFVQQGYAYVYAVPLQDGLPAGRRTILFRAEIGQALFGIKAEAKGPGTGFLVSGIPGTTLLRRQREELLAKAHEMRNPQLSEPVAYLVESWVMGLTNGIIREAAPTSFRPLKIGETISIFAGEKIRPNEDILWIKILEGEGRIAGRSELALAADSRYVPLTGNMWLEVSSDGCLTAKETLSLIDLGADDRSIPLWQSLSYFHELTLRSILANQKQMEKDEKDYLQINLRNDQALLKKAFTSLEEAVYLTENKIVKKSTKPLMEVFYRIGNKMEIPITSPPNWVLHSNKSVDELVRSISRSSKVRYRVVELKGKWWTGDHGSLLGFGRDDNRPFALLPENEKRYRLYDPQTVEEPESRAADQGVIITSKLAEGISARAYMFYPPLPSRKLNAWDILAFARRNIWKKDLLFLLGIGLSGGLMSIVVPYMTGILFDRIIPGAERSQMSLFIQFLLVNSFVVFIFNITRSIAVLRLETRIDTYLQAAIWDRLLQLPLNFFRRYSAGDLASRAMGINSIRTLVSGVTANALFSSIFSLFNLVLMFHYYPKLAWIALTLILAAMLCTMILSYISIRYQRDVMGLEGHISGLLLQIINGINRFRMAGAESRAYYLWARKFGEQRQKLLRQQRIGNYSIVFSSLFPLLASVVIFAALFSTDTINTSDFSAGLFLAFFAAFTVMLTSMMSLSSEMVSLMKVIPLYERIKPLLEALPEGNAGQGDPGELKGQIEVGNLSFRYEENGPLVLNDVNLKIEPGQFVAIVGASGSGKSTLLRLLMGFEKADTGAVYFDNQDIDTLNLNYLRNQFGVVLQNDRLIPGSIYENLVGVGNISMDDTWEALRLAGIEKEIKQMPMGLHTYIAESGSNISGGQRQRLLIARAIVKKPRIVFFDEATSALDNKSQALVSRSLEALKVTRLIIAHRLSTVENADMIYVMDQGKVLESGSYTELMQQGGFFSELAKRQIA